MQWRGSCNRSFILWHIWMKQRKKKDNKDNLTVHNIHSTRLLHSVHSFTVTRVLINSHIQLAQTILTAHLSSLLSCCSFLNVTRPLTCIDLPYSIWYSSASNLRIRLINTSSSKPTKMRLLFTELFQHCSVDQSLACYLRVSVKTCDKLGVWITLLHSFVLWQKARPNMQHEDASSDAHNPSNDPFTI